jgi:hypothetical protein
VTTAAASQNIPSTIVADGLLPIPQEIEIRGCWVGRVDGIEDPLSWIFIYVDYQFL